MRSPIRSRKRKAVDPDDEIQYDSEEIEVKPISKVAPPHLSPKHEQNKRRRVLDYVLIPVPKCSQSRSLQSHHRAQIRAFSSTPDKTESDSSDYATQPESSRGTTQRPRRAASRPSYVSKVVFEESSEDELPSTAPKLSAKPRKLAKTQLVSHDSDFQDSAVPSSEDAASDLEVSDEAMSDTPAMSVSEEDEKAAKRMTKKPATKATSKAKASNTKASSKGKNSKQAKGTSAQMHNLTGSVTTDGSKLKGLDYSLPPIHQIGHIFQDMTSKALGLGLAEAIKHRQGRPLRIATMCSGTEAPVLAFKMMQEALKPYDLDLNMVHLFSAEIVPFKQAYIEKNFSPPIIFRDITELIRNPEVATTAYGAEVPIPEHIDFLIAGTSCVDFSNLNKLKKGKNEGGESGSTFNAVLAFVKRSRPAIVLLENVFGAPWDEMIADYEATGYLAIGVKVDTKDFYIPQTRQRGYLASFDRSRMRNVDPEALTESYLTTMEGLKRPASSPFSAFLQSNRDRSARDNSYFEEDLKREIDWRKCKSRHWETRAAFKIGNARPYSHWHENGSSRVPEHGDRHHLEDQVERVKDYTDIAMLQKLQPLKKGQVPVDVRYKRRLWDVSQNIDISLDTAQRGIIGCITPTGMPFVSDLARPLTAEEKLSLQGIPLDMISFTIETPAEKADLAGNAMTTTVVGSAMIAALIAGHKLITPSAPSDVPLAGRPGQQSLLLSNTSRTRDRVSEVLGIGTVDLPSILAEAEKTTRRCYCEGASRVARRAIQRCRRCGHTTCVTCGGNPIHEYRQEQLLTKLRASPQVFHEKVELSLPLRIRAPQAPTYRDFAFNSPKTHATYLALLGKAATEDFGRQQPQRTSCWRVPFASETSGSRIELVIDDGRMQWQFFVAPPADTAANDPLRRMLQQPIATAEISDSLFDLAWSWRKPEPTELRTIVKASSEQAPTILARERLPDHARSTQPKSLSIRVEKNGNSWLSCDVDGTYHYLPRCGTSLECSYKREPRRSGELPMYLFQDPDPVGADETDCFVFSTTMERFEDDETRVLEAWLPPSWSPWKQQAQQTTVLSYERVTLAAAELAQPLPTSVELGTGDSVSGPASSCEEYSEMLSLSTAADLREPSQLGTSHVWIGEAMRSKLQLNDWRSIEVPEASCSCTRCAPARPAPRWKLATDGVTIERYEDPRTANGYEKSMKVRPRPTSVQVTNAMSNDISMATVHFLVNLRALAHRAIARLLQGAANDVHLQTQWRLTRGLLGGSTFSLKPFKLRETNHIRPYADNLDVDVSLSPKQRGSLAWMLQQEEGKLFTLEVTEDVAVPELDVRLEMRASRKQEFRGGILAESPGYGKTILCLALVHAQFKSRTASQIVDDLRLRQQRRPEAAGLIPTAATLYIVPQTLVGQWKGEAREKGGFGGDEIVTITTASQLDKFKIDNIKRAKHVIVSRNVLTSIPYVARLATAAALPEPMSLQGRAMWDWLEVARSRMPEHVQELENHGLAARRQHAKARYHADMNSDTFKSIVPSRRTRGKDYVSAVNKKSTSNAVKPAARDLDTTTMATPLFEMFFWNRIVVDECQENDPTQRVAIYGLSADKAWGLSATPPKADLWDVAQLGRVLGCPLPVGSTQKGIMKTKNAREYYKDMTQFEKFEANMNVPSEGGYARQYEVCQSFLDIFASQNIELFDWIPSKDHLLVVQNSLGHQTLYNELFMQADSQGMQIRKGSRHKTTAREQRFDTAVEDTSTAEAALSKRAAFFDHRSENATDLDTFIQQGQLEVQKLSEWLTKAVPTAKAKEPEVFAKWKEGRVDMDTIGDPDVRSLVQEACALKASSARAMADLDTWDSEPEEATHGKRDLTSQVGEKVDRLLIAKRTLRYFNNVKMVQATSISHKKLCSRSKCTSKDVDVAVAIECGHVFCRECYDDHLGDDSQCPTTGCQVDVSDHAFWKSKMPAQTTTTTPYGAKLAAAVNVLKEIRKLGDQAILFVQFENQLGEVRLALEDASISATYLDPSEATSQLKDFKETASEKQKKTVIVVNASSETAAGINLQNTNHVIFLSPLLRDQQNAYQDTMLQAIGRARRHLQEKTVHIYYIVAKDTIDVDVLEHRERRSSALTEQGAPPIRMPARARSLQMSNEPKPEKTQLVRGEDGRFSLQPMTWLACAGNGPHAQAAPDAHFGGRKHRIQGYEDFSSLARWSRAFTEDDEYQ
ncbi:uncharacterized protein LTR77_006305 [Saxophila tyrrhenica]|uniref:Helicase C-terminal domain-containing protein n=1 Tax=Saxophila tyrrhenica TaxID=1690608 RepID=A0AAV9P9M9_9PEZI|nr:hypothetical protein LTR77_006305 [Saxophila tyrrhenica]